jgi:two-component system sensor histidine kinase/response regulator
LNTELGLKRVLGKEPLYLELLKKYIVGQSNTADVILQALKINDKDLAERTAHTAKAVSGNIGASGLQELAAELESMIHNQEPFDDIEPKLQVFASMQQTLIESIQHALPTVNKKKTLIDEAALTSVLRRLAVALVDNDSEANEILELNFDLLRASTDQQQFTALEGAISRFDYEIALDHLKQIASIRNIVLDTSGLPN